MPITLKERQILVKKLSNTSEISKKLGWAGNGAIYPWVPPNEIWIEAGMEDNDIVLTLVHEYIEFCLMIEKGMGYEKAHDEANKFMFANKDRFNLETIAMELHPSLIDKIGKVGNKSLSNKSHPFTLAIDFDRTIAEGPIHDLRAMKLREGAKEAIERFYDNGIRIIIWTCRDDLDNVADWLDINMIPYDHINQNPDQTTDSRKIMADYYIDDRGISANQPWDKIEREVELLV